MEKSTGKAVFLEKTFPPVRNPSYETRGYRRRPRRRQCFLHCVDKAETALLPPTHQMIFDRWCTTDDITTYAGLQHRQASRFSGER